MNSLKIRHILLMLAMSWAVGVFAQWTWRNPLPQGNPLSDLHFLSPDEGFATGRYSTVMKTQNGGLSWELSQVDETATTDPTEIFMTSSENGYIVDYYGAVYRTTDGGQSWFLIGDLDEYLHGLWFLNDSVGFVIGADGLFQKTTDYGLTWGDVNPGLPESFTDICFPDPLTGYVSTSTGAILKSTDGGESWFAIGNIDSMHVSEIRFVNGSCGFALTKYGNSSFYRTDDGGNTWTQLLTYYDSCEFRSIWPFNGDTILLSGLDVSSYYLVPFLLRSVDGGVTWTLLPHPSSFTNPEHFQGFPDGVVFATNYFSVVKSPDYGNTWIDGSRDIARNIISDIHFPGVDVGYALSSFLYSFTDTRILKTTDGGETWDSIANLGSMHTFNSIFFTSENHGLIAGYGCFLTWDGGLSWSEVHPGISEPYNAVYFPTSTRGFIVADNGKMAKTDDSGQSWTEIASGTDKTLFCAHFPDPLHGYISGRGVLLKTSDGGDTWNLNQPFGNSMIRGIYFTAADTGFVCGTSDGGCIYKTVDGGTTWTDISCYAPTNGWNSCFFVDADTGYVAGWELYPIMKTRNGGITWEKQHLPTLAFLHKIFFTTSSTGFAAGWNSTLIGTTNGGYTGIGTIPNNPGPTAKIYPNPVNTSATVEYVLDKETEIFITVYSASGKIVLNLSGLLQQPGAYTLPLSVLHLPNGLYFCRIGSALHSETIKVVVQH